MIEEIVQDNVFYALIIRANYKKEGVEFFTKNEYAIQMGYMNREKGYTVARHKHSQIVPSLIPGMNQEVLMIRTGRIKVDIYNLEDNLIASATLHSGDVIMFFRGGHSFEMLESSDFIEIKQGPFGGPSEKILF